MTFEYPPPPPNGPQYPQYGQPYGPQFGPPYGAPMGPPPNNFLVPAILVTVLCCVPFGIPAIVFAAQVNGKYQLGDYAGAQDAARKARVFTWVAFGVGIVLIGLFVVLAFVGAATDTTTVNDGY